MLEVALALSTLGAAFFAVVLTVFAIAAWHAVYDVGLLVEGHLANLDKVALGELDPDRSVAEKVWFAILLIAALAAVLSGDPLRRLTLEGWAVMAGLFFVLAIAAGLVEYLRYMIKWRGVLFAAWDLLAWIGSGLATLILIALIASFAKGCYDAIRPDPNPADERSPAGRALRP